MELRNRRDLKERRQELATEQRNWEREEMMRVSRKKQAESKPGKISKKSTKIESQEEDKLDKDVISLTQIVNDFDSKKYGDKKLHEILKMIQSEKDEQWLMGIYALYQYQAKNGADSDFTLKVHKAGAHEKIALTMKTREDFRLIILKYLTSMFSIQVFPEVCLDIDLLFTPLLIDLLQESDFYYLCYGLNLIGKIMKNHQRTEKEMSSERFMNLIKKVLATNEELKSQQSSDQIVGVKYYVFNSLLEMSSPKLWPELAFEWMQFTCRILNQGLIRNKKSKKVEDWLKSDKRTQEKILNRHDEEIAELTKLPGVIFYLLYLLDSQKPRLVNLPGVREICHKELVALPHAAV